VSNDDADPQMRYGVRAVRSLFALHCTLRVKEQRILSGLSSEVADEWTAHEQPAFREGNLHCQEQKVLPSAMQS
jgi:hypothetical protein